jgi:thioredoxin-dependent peroxiredoxin
VEGVLRSTFVIDGQGMVVRAYANVKAAGHAAKVLADLRG